MWDSDIMLNNKFISVYRSSCICRILTQTYCKILLSMRVSMSMCILCNIYVALGARGLTAQIIVTVPVIKIKFVQHMENTNLCIVTLDLLVFMSAITLPVTSLSILLWLILRLNPKYLLCLINLT